MADYETFTHDVLVIGAGGAGLRAAIEASAAGVKVGMACKSLLGKAHTVMAEGGIAAALGNVDDRDNWKVHFADTMRGGQYVNQWRMAELHAKEAPDRVRELEAWGAVFDRTKDGKILQRNFGGHKYPRLAHVGDRTGLEMIRTLQDHGIHQGIEVYMEHTILALLKDGDRVVGAFGYERERGRFRIFRAKAIVLATGGIGRAYKITSNSWESTGDGLALAYDAGAELIDMEFVQFHPTGMIWPPSVMGILVTEGVRGEGGILTNKDGKRFMFDQIPENYRAQTADNEEEGWRYCQGDKNARRPPELLTRDHVARCIVREIKEGRGSPHGGVYLDIAWIKQKLPNAAEHIKRKLPSMYHQFKQLADIDITEEAMEIGPTTHYAMGGIHVDPDTQMSRVPGLFAAGECAAGINGANRLGGNSLSDIVVFGKRAGEFAAKFAQENSLGKIDHEKIDVCLL
jgi:succinate dehydrogenase / fumarate reductase flavoprotein subunit